MVPHGARRRFPLQNQKKMGSHGPFLFSLPPKGSGSAFQRCLFARDEGGSELLPQRTSFLEGRFTERRPECDVSTRLVRGEIKASPLCSVAPESAVKGSQKEERHRGAVFAGLETEHSVSGPRFMLRTRGGSDRPLRNGRDYREANPRGARSRADFLAFFERLRAPPPAPGERSLTAPDRNPGPSSRRPFPEAQGPGRGKRRMNGRFPF